MKTHDLLKFDYFTKPDTNGNYAGIIKQPNSPQAAQIMKFNKSNDAVEHRIINRSGYVEKVDTFWPTDSEGKQQLKERTVYQSGYIVKNETFDQLGNPINALKENTCSSWERDRSTHQNFTSIKVADMKHEQIEMVSKMGIKFSMDDFDMNRDAWKQASAEVASSPADAYVI